MASTYPQVLLLGDSLFQLAINIQDGFSFQTALQSHCIRRFDVINRGFSGWNSKNILKYLPDMVPAIKDGSPKIDYLVLLIGANDAMLPIPTGFQGIPIDEYRANVKAIITHPNVVAHNPKIIIVTPPPTDELTRVEVDIAKGFGQVARLASRTAEFAQAARDVAAEIPGTVLVDLWRAIHDKAIELTPGWTHEEGNPWLGTPEAGTSGGYKELLSDGLHMSSGGYKLFYELLVPHIMTDKNLTDWKTWVYPGWMELNIPRQKAV